MDISIITAAADHVSQLRDNLRRQDAQEIERFGVCVRRGLWKSFRGSVTAKTAFVDGEIAAMWGCGGVFLGHTGRPWLLTAPICEKVAVSFVRVYRHEVAEMLEIFPVLENIVDATYAKAIKMLKLAGFEVGEPKPQGFKGELFCKFRKERQGG